MFAIGVSVVSVWPIFFGARVPGIWLAVLFVALFVVLAPANLFAVALMGKRVPTSYPPLFRIALTVFLGLLVAGTGTLWVFSGLIGAVQTTGEFPDVEAAAQRLAEEKATYLEILARPRPVVAEDREVIRLGRELDAKAEERKEARNQVLCEQDGKCGTGVRGEGPEYRSKLEHQKTVEGEYSALSSQLDLAKATAESRLRDFDGDQRDARTRIDELDRQPEPPAPDPGKGRDRLAAFNTVAERDSLQVAGTFLALLALFGVVDHWLLFVVVRSVCRRDDGRPLIDEDLIAKRRARAEDSRSAVPYREYAAGQPGRPLAEGDGER
ncbi:DUF4407 domain-containing protein [Amycolatopsis sp. DG1A-15b]|uniref:DUF4407 domain-containing protein n=1 Tax=Amycolatopsis sp. DG1A-15b TaxID=3052846 RepID=UPI00255B8AEE|nr:DUF4407 domain-containing protein [Amycolatopsis sp. DG1A-15b]WIX92971.1 DUF4407 domain-containing protein [Amycolatopsis sp. DG1A-15b]